MDTESWGQWLYVQMEVGDKWCPLCSVLGQVFLNVFLDDIDSRIKCTLSRFGTKKSGAVGTTEGQDDIQRDQA